MADNFRRLAGSEPAGTRFIIWAHNGHIMTGNSEASYVPFGVHLRRYYGNEGKQRFVNDTQLLALVHQHCQ